MWWFMAMASFIAAMVTQDYGHAVVGTGFLCVAVNEMR